MKSIDKLVKEGNIETLEKRRREALSSQNAVPYTLCSLELGIGPGALEDHSLFERGVAELDSQYKIKPERFLDALNNARTAPSVAKQFEPYRDFYIYPAKTNVQRKRAATEVRKILSNMFPLDSGSISKMSDKHMLFSYYSIRKVYG